MRLRTLIVDDEKPARQKIRHFLELDSEIEVIGECANGPDALEAIRGKKPDLLFLDIHMPMMDGFALLKRTGPERPSAVIFVTAFDEYAVKAFEANAADYLLKPFTRRRFDAAVRKVKEQIRQKLRMQPAEQAIELLEKFKPKHQYRHRIAVKSERGILFVRCEQIDWIETRDNYVVLHAGKDTHLVRESMNSIAAGLDPSRFVRIHRRILVNTERIREMHPQRHSCLILQNGEVLPVSRRMKDKVKRFLVGGVERITT